MQVMGYLSPSCNRCNVMLAGTIQTTCLQENLIRRDNLIQMDQQKSPQYHLSSKTEHNGALSH